MWYNFFAKGGESIALSSFLVKFPKEFPEEKRQSLCEVIYLQSFIELKTFATDIQREFAFEENMTAEEVRRRFKIPAEVEVINTSDWNHIPA